MSVRDQQSAVNRALFTVPEITRYGRPVARDGMDVAETRPESRACEGVLSTPFHLHVTRTSSRLARTNEWNTDASPSWGPRPPTRSSTPSPPTAHELTTRNTRLAPEDRGPFSVKSVIWFPAAGSRRQVAAAPGRSRIDAPGRLPSSERSGAHRVQIEALQDCDTGTAFHRCHGFLDHGTTRSWSSICD